MFVWIGLTVLLGAAVYIYIQRITKPTKKQTTYRSFTRPQQHVPMRKQLPSPDLLSPDRRREIPRTPLSTRDLDLREPVSSIKKQYNTPYKSPGLIETRRLLEFGGAPVTPNRPPPVEKRQDTPYPRAVPRSDTNVQIPGMIPMTGAPSTHHQRYPQTQQVNQIQHQTQSRQQPIQPPTTPHKQLPQPAQQSPEAPRSILRKGVKRPLEDAPSSERKKRVVSFEQEAATKPKNDTIGIKREREDNREREAIEHEDEDTVMGGAFSQIEGKKKQRTGAPERNSREPKPNKTHLLYQYMRKTWREQIEKEKKKTEERPLSPVKASEPQVLIKSALNATNTPRKRMPVLAPKSTGRTQKRLLAHSEDIKARTELTNTILESALKTPTKETPPTPKQVHFSDVDQIQTPLSAVPSQDIFANGEMTPGVAKTSAIFDNFPSTEESNAGGFTLPNTEAEKKNEPEKSNGFTIPTGGFDFNNATTDKTDAPSLGFTLPNDNKPKEETPVVSGFDFNQSATVAPISFVAPEPKKSETEVPKIQFGVDTAKTEPKTEQPAFTGFNTQPTNDIKTPNFTGGFTLPTETKTETQPVQTGFTGGFDFNNTADKKTDAPSIGFNITPMEAPKEQTGFNLPAPTGFNLSAPTEPAPNAFTSGFNTQPTPAPTEQTASNGFNLPSTTPSFNTQPATAPTGFPQTQVSTPFNAPPQTPTSAPTTDPFAAFNSNTNPFNTPAPTNTGGFPALTPQPTANSFTGGFPAPQPTANVIGGFPNAQPTGFPSAQPNAFPTSDFNVNPFQSQPNAFNATPAPTATPQDTNQFNPFQSGTTPNAFNPTPAPTNAFNTPFSATQPTGGFPSAQPNAFNPQPNAFNPTPTPDAFNPSGAPNAFNAFNSTPQTQTPFQAPPTNAFNAPQANAFNPTPTANPFGPPTGNAFAPAPTGGANPFAPPVTGGANPFAQGGQPNAFAPSAQQGGGAANNRRKVNIKPRGRKA